MTFNEFEANVMQWSMDRGIYAHSTAQAQVLKAVSEMGELADNIVKGKDVTDDIGDIIVCLINVAFLERIDMVDAFDISWRDIKNRTGQMVPGGAFVKDEEKRNGM